MCSGCSGNCEDDGDWEQYDTSMSECDPEAFWVSLRERWRLWATQADAIEAAPLDFEDYEILVTGDRIVERRTVRAKSCVVSEKASEGGWHERGENSTSGERSWAASAKDYQTLSAFQKMSDRLDFGSRKRRLWRHLAGLAIAGAVFWLASW